jgi:DNA-binding NarL/FixJ family response regulator
MIHLLYVENHATFAETVKQKFLSEYSVTIVPSLSSAREKLKEKENSFDVLLVDYDLDDGKGDELVREVRASASAKRIAIIGVSSHEAGNAALLQTGADAVCSKLDFDRIQSVIGRMVG